MSQFRIKNRRGNYLVFNMAVLAMTLVPVLSIAVLGNAA